MRLHHSAVIELFGICVAPSGLLLIVTEFCELDLTTLIARGRQQERYLGMHDAILWRDLANQMCSGMRYLHAQNIMHRDLKPDNVVLVPLASGPGGAQRYQAKICDFGISKLMQSPYEHVAHRPRAALVRHLSTRLPGKRNLLRSHQQKCTVVRTVPLAAASVTSDATPAAVWMTMPPAKSTVPSAAR